LRRLGVFDLLPEWQAVVERIHSGGGA
jgi:hypothetical protein